MKYKFYGIEWTHVAIIHLKKVLNISDNEVFKNAHPKEILDSFFYDLLPKEIIKTVKHYHATDSFDTAPCSISLAEKNYKNISKHIDLDLYSFDEKTKKYKTIPIVSSVNKSENEDAVSNIKSNSENLESNKTTKSSSVKKTEKIKRTEKPEKPKKAKETSVKTEKEKNSPAVKSSDSDVQKKKTKVNTKTRTKLKSFNVNNDGKSVTPQRKQEEQLISDIKDYISSSSSSKKTKTPDENKFKLEKMFSKVTPEKIKEDVSEDNIIVSSVQSEDKEKSLSEMIPLYARENFDPYVSADERPKDLLCSSCLHACFSELIGSNTGHSYIECFCNRFNKSIYPHPKRLGLILTKCGGYSENSSFVMKNAKKK